MADTEYNASMSNSVQFIVQSSKLETNIIKQPKNDNNKAYDIPKVSLMEQVQILLKRWLMQQQGKEHNKACYTREEITRICSLLNTLIASKEPVYILYHISKSNAKNYSFGKIR